MHQSYFVHLNIWCDSASSRLLFGSTNLKVNLRKQLENKFNNDVQIIKFSHLNSFSTLFQHAAPIFLLDHHKPEPKNGW